MLADQSSDKPKQLPSLNAAVGSLGRLRKAAPLVLLPWLAFATAARADPPANGQLIAGVQRGYQPPHVVELVDVATGARRPLPLGHHNRGSPDMWSASRASAHVLLRADDVGYVDFFDSRTLEPLPGGFSLEAMSGTHQPEFLGTPRLSPDGQYVLAWWQRNAGNWAPELTIFDRQGHVVREVLEPSVGNRDDGGTAAWSPNQAARYVLVDDDGVHVCQLGTDRCLFAPSRLPNHQKVRGTQIAVSPDGQHLAIVLGQFWADSSGQRRSHSTLFTSRLDGSELRQLTFPSKAMQESGTDDSPTNVQWSPDGRWIAFTARGKNPYAAPWYYNSCDQIRAVDVQGPMQEVGAGYPPHGLLMAGGKPVMICSTMQWFD